MNLKCRLILEDYRRQHDAFEKLSGTVCGMVAEIVERLGISVLAIEHRVKTEQSLTGKLERKGDSYTSLDDITDIVGCRVVCFLSDEIDRIGECVEQRFNIDWENSSDKRALIKEDSFGYLSLHYICSLPHGQEWPDEICGRKFEIQIRTVLQHAWSVIQHDIGYKSDFGVPRNISRQFARLAGLLELADDEFVRSRNAMLQYTEDIRNRIRTNAADDVRINMISLREYVLNNEHMRSLTEEIAAISHAEIQDIDPESYVSQLEWFGIRTLGGVRTLLEENRNLALTLARKALSNAELDIVSSNVSLRFLCRAELIRRNCGLDEMTEFLKLSLGTDKKAERQARYLLRQKETDL